MDDYAPSCHAEERSSPEKTQIIKLISKVNFSQSHQIILEGFIDRSSTKANHGPIEFVEGNKGTWTCETGILPGHQPDAIVRLRAYFKPAFGSGDFSNLLAYMRPDINKPSAHQL